MSPDACGTLIEKLLPLGDIITPNIPEAEKLCGFAIQSEDDMIRSRKKNRLQLKWQCSDQGRAFNRDSRRFTDVRRRYPLVSGGAH